MQDQLLSFIEDVIKCIDDINEPLYVDGSTMLHKAVEANLPSVVNLLFDKGANPNIANKEGLTPVHMAIIQGSVEMTSLLLCKGGKITDFRGHTPMHLAALSGCTHLIDLLIEAKYDMNELNERGEPPLFIAVMSNNVYAAHALIKGGANPNYQAKELNLNTCLHIAVSNNDLKMVKVLVEGGSLIHLQDDVGMTPLTVACVRKHYDIVKFLLEKGADPKLPDKNGFSALRAARAVKDETLLKLFANNGETIVDTLH